MRNLQIPTIRTLSIILVWIPTSAVISTANAECSGTNTCLGEDALSSDEDGSDNTAIGFGALRSSISGSSNTAVGYEALRENFANLNTAIGAFALVSNTIGNHNTAVGNSALSANTTGAVNTAVGSAALGANNGTGNSAMGFAALAQNTTGNRNVAVGHAAMNANTTGRDNTATGNEALRHNTTGYANSADGQLALWSNTTGRQNTATGGSALYNNTSGIHGAAFGNRALFNATTGFRNVAIGFQAGYAVTTGSDNIIIGGENKGLTTDNGVIRIGGNAYQKRTFIAGIRGVTTGSTNASTVFVDVNGQLGTIKSSSRFKEDIHPMGSLSERLFALRPVTFRYKEPDEEGSKPLQFGLLAEEVAEAFPELVVYGEDGKPETVSYHLLATLLLNEFQKQHNVTQAQVTRIAFLEKQAEELAQLREDFSKMAEVIDKLDRDRMVATAD